MSEVIGIGAAPRRKEDLRFLTGRGNYVADIERPGMVFGVFVRSPHAHARINSIDPGAALAMPGAPGFGIQNLRATSYCEVAVKRSRISGNNGALEQLVPEGGRSPDHSAAHMCAAASSISHPPRLASSPRLI
jgi:Aldehyde oxidase and xanthine dehydrogenase, a/b hammerhead domain